MSFYTETTGYIVHQRNFKDSSLIIEFFSQDYGLIHLIAKGIKKNKQLKSQIQYFSLLKIQFFGKSQLKTVAAINVIKSLDIAGLINKTAGLYLNELIHLSLIENEQSDAVFLCYEDVLSQLGKQRLTPLLRQFELAILKQNGFELDSSLFNQAEQWLGVDHINGLVIADHNNQKICTVDDVHMFLNGVVLDSQAQKRINKMMIKVIDLSVSHKRIYSRELLKGLTTK